MSATAPWLALGRPAAVNGASAAHGRERARTRLIFAACYTLVVFVEGSVYAFDYGHRLAASTLLQWAGSACIDGTTWWACIAMAERGWRLHAPRPGPYVTAAVVAAIVATLLHVYTATWFFAPSPNDSGGRALTVLWMMHLMGLWRAGIVTIAYYFRLRHLDDGAALHAARLRRAALARRAVEARLQATQARIDPHCLFDSLAQIERLCLSDPDRADRILEALIAFLRAALPESDGSARTLEAELSLAGHYVALVEAREGYEIELTVDADAEARQASVPSNLLLPLIEEACAMFAASRGRATITIAARFERDCLRAEIRIRGGIANGVAASNARVESVRQQIAEVFGSAARLDIHRTIPGETTLILELPDERADRRHRRG
jgi:hypothetical protein